MSNFDMRRSIDELTAYIVRDIPSPRTRREVAREYADHVEDAVYRHMLTGKSEEEAFRLASRELGAPEEFAPLLADIHSKTAEPEEFQAEKRAFLSRRILATLLTVAALTGLYFLWGIFVVQVLLIVVGIFVLLCLLRYTRTLRKRAKAVRRIRKAAQEKGYICETNNTAYTSVFRPSERPAILLDDGERVYKIRFLPVLYRRCRLYFVAKNVYYITRMKGAAIMHARFGPLAAPNFAAFFMPRMHSELAAFAQSFLTLPTMEKRHDRHDRIHEEVLILNPVPMCAFYRVKNTYEPLLGGEKHDGVWIHDIAGFLHFLREK